MLVVETEGTIACGGGSACHASTTASFIHFIVKKTNRVKSRGKITMYSEK
jgi:hypothetical protein